jgi:hypothetical protein
MVLFGFMDQFPLSDSHFCLNAPLNRSAEDRKGRKGEERREEDA